MGLTMVQLNGDVQMIPLGSVARKHYEIPFLPLTDEGDAELPQAIRDLCSQLSVRGDLAYIEAEIFGGMGNQAHVLVGAGGKVGSVVVAPDAINAALRSLGVQVGQDVDEFKSLGLGRCRDTDAWIDGAEE
jgi:hypothetical protein